MAKRPTKPKPAELPAEAGPMFITISEQTSSTVARLYNPTDAESVARGLQGTVSVAANIKAKVFSSLPLRLMRVKRGGGKGPAWRTRAVKGWGRRFLAGELDQQPSAKALTYGANGDVEEVLDHPAVRLLQDPEPMQTTGTQWWWLFHMMRQLTGRSFLWDGGDYVPQALWMLRNPFVTIKYSKTNLVDGYWYGRDSVGKCFIPSNEVIYQRSAGSLTSHVDAWSWATSVAGLSALEAAAVQSEVARWGNSGQPSMVFKTKGEQPWDRKKIQEAKTGLSEQVLGVNKHGQSLILNALELVQYASKPHELNYEAGLNLAEMRIFRAAGIPEPLWKMAAANKASAIAADPAFASMTVMPECNVVADEFTEMLLPRYGVEPGEMWFQYDNPVKEDREQARVEAVSLYTGGLIRRGAALARITGYDPVPEEENVYTGQPVAAVAGGDGGPDAGGDIRVDAAAVPIDSATATTIAGLTKDAMAGTMPVESARALALMLVPGKEAEVNAVFDGVRAAMEAKAQEEADEEDEPEGVDDETVPADTGEGDDEGDVPGGSDETSEKSHRDVLRGTANDNGGDDNKAVCTCTHSRTKADPVMDEALKRAVQAIIDTQIQSAVFGPDGIVSIPDGTDAALRQVFDKALADLFQQGAEAMAGSVGEEPTITPANAIEYSREHAAKLVTEVTDTTRERIQTTVTDGLASGKTIAEVQADITANAPEISNQRAETIARSETAQAQQMGENVQAEELEYNVKKWVLAGGPCPLCAAAEAEKSSGVPTTEPFYKAGDTITGTDGKSYTLTQDVMVPSQLHPNCRCVSVYEKGTSDANA